MITRCPHCRTAFRVSEEHLVPAAGEVQCGICNQRFDGVANLQPEVAAPSADSGITGAKSTIDRPYVEEIEIPVWAFNDLESSERPADPTQSEDGVPEEQESRLRIDQAILFSSPYNV